MSGIQQGAADPPQPARWVPPRAVVPALTCLWVAVAVAGLRLVPGVPVGSARPAPALLIVLLFAATQTFVINVQRHREARSVFISEIPTFLALMSLSPQALVSCRVVGLLLGFGVVRRQYRHPQKLLFNACLAAAEVTVAVVVFRALLPVDAGSAVSWLAAAAGCAAASAFTGVAVSTVIGLLEGAVHAPVLLRTGTEALLQAVLVAAVGAAVWAAWEDDPWALVPLVVVAGVVLFSYRAYASLRERHLALERLYRFSQVMSHAPGVDEVLRGVLQQAREILHTERARVLFLPGGASEEALEVVLSGPVDAGQLHHGEPVYLADADWAVRPVLRGAPVLVPRGTRDPVQRAWLEEHRLRDSIMVPLLGDSGPVGVLAVDDRLGDARGLVADDVRVLETVANQASVALRNGQLLDQLRHDSLHDPLTGLPNRLQLHRELERRLAALPTSGFAVGILDLDAFKEVNDTLGHAEGDRLLCEVALRVRSALDSTALVARLGGDEFAVLADGCWSVEDAERLGATVHAALRGPVLLGGIEVNVSGSLGLVLAPMQGRTASLLLQRADQAMYDAKSAGRQVRVFDPALDTASPSKLALVGELRAAIEGGEVEVHVQPKVRSSSGAVCGSEALARWSTPTRGWVSPADFVPLAERSGLIGPLTELVLDQAVGACAGWQAQAPGVGVSVNVSVRSLTDGELVHTVQRVLHRHRLAPALLTLEITESHIMADPAGCLDVLHQLRDLGLRLSVDDFGTGYSSLSYLRRLPVDEVKIDRSFVAGMVQEPDDAAIVRSIVELARALSLHVVAEGVEDDQTWAALDALGVDEIQGWVVAKAMPRAEFGGWARHRRQGRPRLRAV